MKIYIITLIVIIGLIPIFFTFKKNKYKNMGYLFLTSFMLYFVSAFRLNTGYDYPAYARSFMLFYNLDVSQLITQRFEKGFLWINTIIMKFTDDFSFLFIITTFICLALIMVFIYKYSKNVWISVLMYFLFGYYFNSMNFLRNMIAALIFLYALKYIESKHLWRYFAVLILASTFHFSAFLIIPFYFILKIKITKVTLAIYSGLTVIFLIFSTDIMGKVTKYFYQSYDPNLSVEIIKGVKIFYPIIFGIIFIVAFLLRRELEERDKFNNILISSAFFNLFFEAIGAKHAILSRYSLFFGVATTVLLIPQIVELLAPKIKIKTFFAGNKIELVQIKSLVLIGVIFISAGVFFMYALINNYNGVVPHNWIWSLI